MDADELLELAGDPRFIEGIYNYCDRWCERCPMTSRCLLYASEQTDNDPSAGDMSNEKFWRDMSAIFQQTIELIARLAEEQGIDLASLDAQESVGKKRQRRKRVRKLDLTEAANWYIEMVSTWLDEEKDLVGRIERASDPITGQGESETREMIEVVLYYQYQIAVKIMRGIGQHDPEEEKLSGGWQKDSDGSVKVALIGIDRSIGAWGELQKLFPEKADSIAPMLIHLERLRRRAEQEFPDARKFQRPGFDFISGDQLH